MTKKKGPKFQVAVFDDGKMLIVSETPLTEEQTEHLGRQVFKFYESKIPAALFLQNSTIYHIPAVAGGPEGTYGIASVKEDDMMISPKQNKPRADTTGMN